MILYINTSIREFLEFALVNKGEVFLLKRKVGIRQSEKALSLLDAFLKKNKFQLTALKKIVVNRGPGSFTAVRLGIVLANTLSFGLKIPVVGVYNLELKDKVGYLELSRLKFSKQFIKPYYDRDPDITKSKKKGLIVKK
jgi:tRNA threonylcarbamoyl adenosine modification protein YeaZ